MVELVVCIRCLEPTRREAMAYVAEADAWMCERCALVQEAMMDKAESLAFGNEKRLLQLASWTQEELIDAVLTLEAEAREWSVPHRAVVTTRQGPHRVKFAISFENSELFELVLRTLTERSLDKDKEKLRAFAEHVFISHYLFEARHEETWSGERKFYGGQDGSTF